MLAEQVGGAPRAACHKPASPKIIFKIQKMGTRSGLAKGEDSPPPRQAWHLGLHASSCPTALGARVGCFPPRAGTAPLPFTPSSETTHTYPHKAAGGNFNKAGDLLCGIKGQRGRASYLIGSCTGWILSSWVAARARASSAKRWRPSSVNFQRQEQGQALTSACLLTGIFSKLSRKHRLWRMVFFQPSGAVRKNGKCCQVKL